MIEDQDGVARSDPRGGEHDRDDDSGTQGAGTERTSRCSISGAGRAGGVPLRPRAAGRSLGVTSAGRASRRASRRASPPASPRGPRHWRSCWRGRPLGFVGAPFARAAASDSCWAAVVAGKLLRAWRSDRPNRSPRRGAACRGGRGPATSDSPGGHARCSSIDSSTQGEGRGYDPTSKSLGCDRGRSLGPRPRPGGGSGSSTGRTGTTPRAGGTGPSRNAGRPRVTAPGHGEGRTSRSLVFRKPTRGETSTVPARARPSRPRPAVSGRSARRARQNKELALQRLNLLGDRTSVNKEPGFRRAQWAGPAHSSDGCAGNEARGPILGRGDAFQSRSSKAPSGHRNDRCATKRPGGRAPGRAGTCPTQGEACTGPNRPPFFRNEERVVAWGTARGSIRTPA